MRGISLLACTAGVRAKPKRFSRGEILPLHCSDHHLLRRTEQEETKRSSRARYEAYYVYIMASQSRTLNVGITNNLERRVFEHKQKADTDSFTSRYNITNLVWFAETNEVIEAIAKEKEIKGWTRAKKKALIEENNPGWRDLSEEWYAWTDS